ncbi:uncharacterized protein LOC119583268 [Penaeus monodon]|uniref:uncharacterized protein LOC119583268 n=1 Tax=Penaeus monodon TaxID=6687 RepID=UPI0018A6DA14|nr:uncharacterized protein LOC119583268 [Penaeus monodon]
MACSIALFVAIIALIMCFLVVGLIVMASRLCKKQQRKKCPRVVISFRPQPGSSSILNSPFRPPTSGPPYTATTLPLKEAKYNVPLRLCPTPGIQFDGYSTRTGPKSFCMSTVPFVDAWLLLSNVIFFSSDEIINMQTKIRSLKCYVWSTLCGCETWTISKAMEKGLIATEMWFLRRMLMTWMKKPMSKSDKAPIDDDEP